MSDFALHPRVRFRRLGGRAVIVHQGTAEVVGLNATGTATFEGIKDGKSLDVIVEELSAKRGAPERTTIADEVRAFVVALVDANILERS